ncbi:MAG: hypothetical protein V1816_20465 [Pseudomonadota bacterium]
MTDRRHTRFLSGSPSASLIVCLAGVLLFLLVVIFPNYRNIAREQNRILELQDQIEEQKILKPFFENLKKQEEITQVENLALPKPEKLPRGDLTILAEAFPDLASREGLVFKSLAPLVNTLREDDGQMAVELNLTGGLFNFRKFLIRLGALPYLSHIEEIAVRANEDYTLRVWATMEQNPGNEKQTH